MTGCKYESGNTSTKDRIVDAKTVYLCSRGTNTRAVEHAVVCCFPYIYLRPFTQDFIFSLVIEK